MGILQLKNLKYKAGDKTILNGITADFWDGHVHAVVGPNGAGKSTLAYTIMGLSSYRDFEGDIIFKGEKLNDIPIDERAKRGITLAWQEPARFEGLKIRDFLKAAAKDKSEKNLRAAMEMMGLNPSDYMNRAVDKTLSGGERKRVELASIFVMEPDLVLLDEPDSGIDVAALEKIFDMIKILKERGTTIILITHSPTVLKQSEHAFIMCCGQIIDKGTTDKVKDYFNDRCIPCDHKNVPGAGEV